MSVDGWSNSSDTGTLRAVAMRSNVSRDGLLFPETILLVFGRVIPICDESHTAVTPFALNISLIRNSIKFLNK